MARRACEMGGKVFRANQGGVLATWTVKTPWNFLLVKENFNGKIPSLKVNYSHSSSEYTLQACIVIDANNHISWQIQMKMW